MDQTNLQVLEQDAQATMLAANDIKITNDQELQAAADFTRRGKTLKKKFEELLKPIIDKANDALKEARNQLSMKTKPIDEAIAIVDRKMLAYTDEQRRKRAEETRRLQEEERKKEEERRLAMAIEAEKNGKKEEAEKIIEAPITVPRVTIEAPKTEGIHEMTTWDFEVVELVKIPLAYMLPDSVKIRKVVVALHEEAEKQIPGIRAIKKVSIVHR